MNTNDMTNEMLDATATTATAAPHAEAKEKPEAETLEALEAETASDAPAEEATEEAVAAEETAEVEMDEAVTESTGEDGTENFLPADTYFRPRMPFWKKICIYISVWLILTAAGCAVMWNMMQQYEEAQPWFAVEEFLETSVQSAFYDALLDAYPDIQNPYEPIYEIARSVSEKYASNLTYTKLIREYTYEKPVYLLQSGDLKLLKLTLSQGGETGFLRLRGYRVSGVELVSNDIFSLKSYSLTFPKGCAVYINGKMLSRETLRAESGFAAFGETNFYACMLENFFERPTVKAIYRGEELTPLAGENFHFELPEQKLHTITVTAPENAIVRVSAKRVSDHFLTETFTSEPDAFGATINLCTYTIPTVSGEYVVSATVDGELLTIEQNGSHHTVLPRTVSCKVALPKDALLYANETLVAQTFITETNIPHTSVFEGVNKAPLANVYTLEGLYAVPALTASLNGESLMQVKDGEQSVFVSAPSATLRETYTKQAVAFMNAYLYYTTQGYSNTRANLDAAKAHVAYPSPLYTNLERSYIGYYYIAPQTMQVESMTVDNFIPFGENAFTCELSYKIHLKNWVGETTEENTMRIAFTRTKMGFAPVNMLLLEK